MRMNSKLFVRAWRRGSPQTGPGCLVVNPLPFSRKVSVDISAWTHLPAVGGSIIAATEQSQQKTAIVNVPGMGFAWIDPDMPPPEETPEPKKRRRWLGAKKEPVTPPMAEENLLRNDFFEVKVDPVTGAVRSIHDYHTRDNRLAMQLAYRQAPQRSAGSQDDEDVYSVMAADEVAVREPGPLFGELAIRGRCSHAMERSWLDTSRFCARNEEAESWRSTLRSFRNACLREILGTTTMPPDSPGATQPPTSSQGSARQPSPRSRHSSRRPTSLTSAARN